MISYYDLNSSNLDKVAKNNSAIRESIKNILLTPIGSLPGMPDFGSNLHKILFEQADAALVYTISTLIADALNIWEDRIYDINTEITLQPEYNRIKATVNYKIVDTNEQDTTTLILR